MKLIEIDKTRYRRHLNYVIVSCIGVLIIGSLSVSQLLIAIFTEPSADLNTNHFYWNLSGVAITAVAIALILNKYRNHGFMSEVTYVWELKQSLNQITRRLRKIKSAAQQGNLNAMIILQYSYAGSRQLWELDDNAIVVDELAIAQAELDSLATQYQLSLNPNDYQVSMLKTF